MTRLLRSSLFNLCFYAFTLLLALLATPFALLGARWAARRVFVMWSRGVVWLARRVLGGRIEIRGREHMPKGAALIVSKHQSAMDGALIGALYPGVAAVAMRELDRYPLIGRIIDAAGFIRVATEGRNLGQADALVEGARRAHAEGRPVLIYPEGMLMRVGERGRWRSGVWRIYNALGVPAHLVAQDLGRLWPRREWLKNPGAACAVEFLAPIPPGLDKAAFMAEVERRIEAASDALAAEHADSSTLASGGATGAPMRSAP